MKKILPIPILMTLLLCITFAYSESTFISPNQIKGGVYTKSETDVKIAEVTGEVYTKAQTNATIEAAIAAATAEISTNKTVSVTAGEALTAGDAVALINKAGTVKAYKSYIADTVSNTFKSSSTFWICAAKLTETSVVVAYSDAANSNYGTVAIGTISGNTITWGTPVVFYSGYSGYISICRLSDASFVVAWLYASEPYAGYIRAATVSGTTPTFGAQATLSVNDIYHTTLIALDATHFVAAYCENDQYGNVVGGSVSGNTITLGTAVQFDSAVAYYNSLCRVNDNRFILAYRNNSSGYGYALTGTLSGITVAVGSKYAFKSANAQCINVNKIDDFRFLLSYQVYTGSLYNGELVVGYNNGTDLRFGNPKVIESASALYLRSIMHNDTNFTACFSKSDNSNYGTVIEGTISGLTINTKTAITVATSNIDYIAIIPLDNVRYMLFYRDVTNSNYGVDSIISWDCRFSNFAGIAQSTVTENASVDVLVSGVDTHQSGLTPGETYFLQSNYTIGTTRADLEGFAQKIGVAKSATELIINNNYN